MLNGVMFEKTGFITKVFRDDEASIGEIIFKNVTLRIQIRKSFGELYDNKKIWNSDQSILIISQILTELRSRREKALRRLEDLNAKEHAAEKDKTILNMELTTLKQTIKDCKASLLERTITLQETAPKLYENLKTAPHRASESLELALICFKHPELANAVQLDDLIHILNIYYSSGVIQSAGKELATRIGTELTKKINNNELAAEDERVARVAEFFKDDILNSQRLTDAINYQLELKAQAFKKIYTALRDGQSRFMPKTNFLSDKKNLLATELIDKIIDYAHQYPNSRTAKAWSLTQKNYSQCSPANHALFSDIYTWSSSKNWFLFTPPTLEQIVKENTPDSYIHRALR